jgi:hypothetical protein|tara:strand:- start:149 stop:679 length:531 start_codon:yes stop_codon:yes gene_type:complete
MPYKKWILKYKWLNEELNEVELLHNEYIKVFHKDFKSLKSLKNPHESITTSPLFEELDEEKLNPKNGKNLYKKLSKQVHPDKGGDEDEFKEINKLYREENILGMYVKAEELGIIIEEIEDSQVEKTFEPTCFSIEEKTNQIKSTAAWKWGTVKEEDREFLSVMIEEQANVKRRKKQ